MNVRLRLIAAMTLVASLFSVTLTAAAQEDGYQPIGNDEFRAVWERTDLPVAELQVSRTWIWGPGAISGVITEEYVEAEGGERQVQYFDKSRMEMPVDNGDEDSPWFITQGLLATEMMTGRLQLGHNEFEQHEPAEIPVAGDREGGGPTYAVMGEFMDNEPRPTGSVIHQVLNEDGTLGDDVRLANYGVTDEVHIQETNHNIASVFWDLMTSTGMVYEDGEYVEGALFLDAFYAVGFPTTEAYWVRSEVAGEERDVLLQCFERRCLTYAPGNPEGWEVESGNVGLHYYEWRYEIIDEPVEPGEPGEPAIPAAIDVSAASTTIGVGQETTVRALVTDAEGNNVGAGVEVTFSLEDDDNGDDALSLPEERTVATNSAGEALIEVSGDAVGIGTVIATVTVGEGDDAVTITDQVTITVENLGEITLETSATQIGVNGTASITATVTDAEGEPVPAATPIVFTIIDGTQFGNIGGGNQLSVLAADDGTATATLTGIATGNVTVEVSAEVDGHELSEQITIAVRGGAELTLESDADRVEQGESFDVAATATNFSTEPIQHARFNIIVDLPGGCNADDNWGQFFEVTAVNGDTNTQGINDTFECVDNVFRGYWGPSEGYAFPAGDTQDATFTIEVQPSSQIGPHTMTVQIVDIGAGDDDADVVLDEASIEITTRPAGSQS